MASTGTVDRGDSADAFVWRPDDLHGVEALRASYRRQHFAPHAHEGYLIGLIEEGIHAVWCRGTGNLATAGTIATMNPGEVHHGGAGGSGGWRQRMLYVPETAMIEVMRDAADRDGVRAPSFAACFRPDPPLARRFTALHETLAAEEPLARQSALIALVVAVSRRHARLPVPDQRPVGSSGAARRVRDHLEASLSTGVTLQELADVAGLRRRHTIEVFRRQFGLPPHRYLIQRRVERSKELLEQGMPPAEVAAETGFADQSHLTRHFRAIVGTTPARYGRAPTPRFRSIRR